MSRHLTFRVLVRSTATHVIDVIARDEPTALARAERLWTDGSRNRFDRVMGDEPASFELDDMASTCLADVANEDRARWAENALRSFARETGSDLGAEALRDLIADLGHYADEHGFDFQDELHRAAETWAPEKSERGAR